MYKLDFKVVIILSTQFDSSIDLNNVWLMWIPLLIRSRLNRIVSQLDEEDNPVPLIGKIK